MSFLLKQSFTPAQFALLSQLLIGEANFPGLNLCLKSFTGRSQLTGGTPATKMPLMEVPLPNGWISRLDVRLNIEASYNWTNSANTKEWGVAIGDSSSIGGDVNSTVDFRTLSFTTTASISDKLVIGRNGATPSRLYLAVPNNARIFGTNATTGTTVGVLASALIDPDAVDQSIWIWGRIANAADQISLEHLSVRFERGVS